MIQIRNVPEDLHRKIKARAAAEGMTLSDYLLARIRREGERPTMRELRERLQRRGPIGEGISAAEWVRKDRDSR